MLPPFVAIAAILAALIALMGAVRAMAARWGWNPEWQRKLVHLGMGVTALGFPWLFAEPWPVAVLGVLALGALVALKHVPRLRGGIGGVLHDVDRHSQGDLYFAAAVVIVFFASKGDPILFCVPVMILTFADAVGALIGIRYGKTSFATLSGRKSAEGSIMFFLTCFFVAHVPLLLAGSIGRAETLFLSLTLAAMVTMVEAVSTKGIDNLIIPVAGWYLLSQYLVMELDILLQRFFLIAFLMGSVLVVRKRSSLDGSSLLGAVLFAYGCWALGGWPFFVVPVILFINHLYATRAIRRVATPNHDLWAVISIACTGLVWLILQRVHAGDPLRFLFPFVLGISAHFAMRNFATLRILETGGPRRRPAPLIRATGKAVFWCYLPLLFCRAPGAVVVHAAIAAAAVLAVTWIFSRLYPAAGETPTHVWRWANECALATGASTVGLIA